MERNETWTPVNRRRIATFVNMSTHEVTRMGGEHDPELLGKIIAGMEESRRQYNRQKRRWALADTLYIALRYTLIATFVLAITFLILARTGVSAKVVSTFEVLWLVSEAVALVHCIAVKILERRGYYQW